MLFFCFLLLEELVHLTHANGRLDLLKFPRYDYGGKPFQEIRIEVECKAIDG